MSALIQQSEQVCSQCGLHRHFGQCVVAVAAELRSLRDRVTELERERAAAIKEKRKQ